MASFLLNLYGQHDRHRDGWFLFPVLCHLYLPIAKRHVVAGRFAPATTALRAADYIHLLFSAIYLSESEENITSNMLPNYQNQAGRDFLKYISPTEIIETICSRDRCKERGGERQT